MNTARYDHLIDFDDYRYAGMVRLALDQIAHPATSVEIRKEGAEIDLGPRRHARVIRFILERAADFEVSWVHGEDVVAKKVVQGPPAKVGGYVAYRVDVPAKAVSCGYSKLRVFPLRPKRPCVMVDLELAETSGQPGSDLTQ